MRHAFALAAVSVFWKILRNLRVINRFVFALLFLLLSLFYFSVSLQWSVSTLYGVIVGDSGLCCCVRVVRVASIVGIL